MRMNKKRALIGYDPKEVHRLVESMQASFEEEKKRLESELASLTAENVELAKQAAERSKQVSGQLAFERELSGLLLQTHMEYVKKLLQQKRQDQPGESNDKIGIPNRSDTNMRTEAKTS
jgi:hypothetical protein